MSRSWERIITTYFNILVDLSETRTDKFWITKWGMPWVYLCVEVEENLPLAWNIQRMWSSPLHVTNGSSRDTLVFYGTIYSRVSLSEAWESYGNIMMRFHSLSKLMWQIDSGYGKEGHIRRYWREDNHMSAEHRPKFCSTSPAIALHVLIQNSEVSNVQNVNHSPKGLWHWSTI
jgi:hypothetical protein